MILHNILGKGKGCIVNVDKTSPIKIGSSLKHNTNSFDYLVLNIGVVPDILLSSTTARYLRLLMLDKGEVLIIVG